MKSKEREHTFGSISSRQENEKEKWYREDKDRLMTYNILF
jgi:hypothetical protein